MEQVGATTVTEVLLYLGQTAIPGQAGVVGKAVNVQQGGRSGLE